MSTMSITTSSTRPEGAPRGKRAGSRRRALTVTVLRCVLVVFFAFPILFMLVSSLKPDLQIFADLGSWRAFVPVGDVSLDNYADVFDRVPFTRFLLNSVVISGLTVALGIVVNSLAAFALARLRWRGRGLVLGLVLATLIVPFETLALPLLWWVNKLPSLEVDGFSLAYKQGWLDTYQVQIIPFIANAFALYLFYQYFDSIPRELDEAARMDGAGWFTIYRKVVMPLSGPAIATVAILTFLPAWNSYLWPRMVVQSEEQRPVMIGLQYFFQLNTSWGQVMAYSSLITIPVIALFLAFQRSFINSIASSGVKG
ncbi:carbohydrate ABC transporter permease [Parafrankia sp. EUN1f]|uniref:carbohydrate ABC transporter permease n=1 Tax=Parafrankia sp. EUN1f TaxID=102897 RepID=UPI0001C46302|nr:carbohydrate ABC transporter permease [Parafrankia sp. EUN1f]EFC82200.1 binding-protein-dependent transport systems inner membrane component [Parafrankia sp. EUN1f]